MRFSLFYIFLLFALSFSLFSGMSRATEILPTSVEVEVSCGDGLSESANGEVCDPGYPSGGIPQDIGTSTCQDFLDYLGDPFHSGDLGCASDCASFATSSCFTCGNDRIEASEQCDGSDVSGSTCVTWGYSSGTISCSSDCRIDVSDCTVKESEGGSSGSGSSGGGSGPSNSGFDPGSETEQVTTVVIRGKSYPSADVHILVDGKVIGIANTDAKADFYFESSELSSGVTSFGFWSEDSEGLKSTLLTLTLRVISNAVTTISGVNIAPSIDIDKKSVKQGEMVKIYGQTVPDTKINVHIHSENQFIEEATSNDAGTWELVFDTTPLEVNFHTAKALFLVEQDENIIKSGFSRAVSFHVGKIGGEAACAEADLNHDGRVNLTDFSILLFHWGTDNECADQNQNGTVDLVDFSIMMYYWTG